MADAVVTVAVAGSGSAAAYKHEDEGAAELPGRMGELSLVDGDGDVEMGCEPRERRVALFCFFAS
jgi:hypothetical protein